MLLILILGFAPILMLLTLALVLYLTVIELREIGRPALRVVDLVAPACLHDPLRRLSIPEGLRCLPTLAHSQRVTAGRRTSRRRAVGSGTTRWARSPSSPSCCSPPSLWRAPAARRTRRCRRRRRSRSQPRRPASSRAPRRVASSYAPSARGSRPASTGSSGSLRALDAEGRPTRTKTYLIDVMTGDATQSR